MESFIFTHKGVKHRSNYVTLLGEPSCWYELPDGGSMEIKHMEFGKDGDEQFFLIERNCSAKDTKEGKYADTHGIISSLTCENINDISKCLDAMHV